MLDTVRTSRESLLVTVCKKVFIIVLYVQKGHLFIADYHKILLCFDFLKCYKFPNKSLKWKDNSENFQNEQTKMTG